MTTDGPSPTPIVSTRVLAPGRSYDFVEAEIQDDAGRRQTRLIVRHRGAVCVLPLLDGAGERKIVTIRNDRPAVGTVLDELPAGGIDPGETPEACAARELVEETGYRAATLRPVGRFYTSPGFTDELMHAYVATGLTHVGQRLEEDENLTVHPRPVGEVLSMLDGSMDGSMLDGKSMLTIMLAQRLGLLGEG